MTGTALVPTEEATAHADGDLSADAASLIRRHVLYSAASGLIPVPGVDIAASVTAQVHMIASLCELYRLPFSNQAIKATLAAVVASGLPQATAGASTLASLRAVPGFGTVLGVAAMPAYNAAVTWALGWVFSRHFAAGGTLTTLDPADAGARIRRAVAEAASKVKDGAAAQTSAAA